MRLLALLVLAAACGGRPKHTPAPPPAPDPIPRTAGPDCSVVADKLAIVIHADAPDAQDRAKAELGRRCVDDRWSDDARSCFATADTDAELDGCRQHLDDAQQQALANLAPPHDAWGGSAPAAAPAAAPVDTMAPAKPAQKKRSTRGAQPKGDSSDPQEGGE
jgi:hypothetical protein